MRGVIFCLLLISYGSLFAHPGVFRVPMDDNMPQSVPMHPSVTLTIQFPYEIDGLNGAGFTPDITKASGEYLISYTAPNRYFSLYPLVDRPEARNLNVVVKDKIYVLRPYLVSNPDKAWTALIFTDPEKDSKKADLHPRIHKSFKKPKPKLQPSSTAKMIGFMDLTKLLSQLKSPALKEILNLTPNVSVSLRKDNCTNFGTHRIVLDIVARNNDYDMLVFGLRLINDEKVPLTFNPESFTVRCGNNVYTQAISDFQGKVDPGESAVGYFLILGTAEGTPNYLSPENEFLITIDPLEVSST